jgi:hypothetical protein
VASVLCKEKRASRSLEIELGAGLLDTITHGMYDDPLMVYREYIQNAADSIDESIETGVLEHGAGTVTVTIPPRERTVLIEDDGSGLPNDRVEACLGAIGSSDKAHGLRRGFRGIGRLGGAAYCEVLSFETRSGPDEDVATIQWGNGRPLPSSSVPSGGSGLTQALRGLARVSFAPATEADPPRFFRVRMTGVRRFHDDRLLDPKRVATYLSQVAPGQFDAGSFSFAAEVENWLTAVPGYRAYRLQLNGERIFRPYADELACAGGSGDRILGIEKFELADASGEPMGRGWFAVTGFRGAIPSDSAASGIGVREGNIQVGAPEVLRPCFSEQRFVGWQIGEVHVATGALRPNARRDGFEQSPNTERFLEQMSVLGRHLSTLCRRSSKLRCTLRRLDELERLISDSRFWVDEAHRRAAVARVRTQLAHLDVRGLPPAMQHKTLGRSDAIERRCKGLEAGAPLLADLVDGRRLPRGDGKRLLEDICKRLLDCYDAVASGEELVQQLAAPYLKGHRTGSRTDRRKKKR